MLQWLAWCIDLHGMQWVKQELVHAASAGERAAVMLTMGAAT